MKSSGAFARSHHWFYIGRGSKNSKHQKFTTNNNNKWKINNSNSWFFFHYLGNMWGKGEERTGI